MRQVPDEPRAGTAEVLCASTVRESGRIAAVVYVDALLAAMASDAREAALRAFDTPAHACAPEALSRHECGRGFAPVRALAIEVFYSDFVAPGRDGPSAWAQTGFEAPRAVDLEHDWSYPGIECAAGSTSSSARGPAAASRSASPTSSRCTRTPAPTACTTARACWDAPPTPAGVRHAAHARFVVVAAGALNTPRLRWYPGLHHPPIGRHGEPHPPRLLYGRFEQVQDAHRVHPVSAHRMQFRHDEDGGFAVESSTVRDPIAFATTIRDANGPLCGPQRVQARRADRHWVGLLATVDDDNHAAVAVDAQGHECVSVELRPSEHARGSTRRCTSHARCSRPRAHGRCAGPG